MAAFAVSPSGFIHFSLAPSLAWVLISRMKWILAALALAITSCTEQTRTAPGAVVTPSARPGIEAKVVSIHDGDSLTVMMDGKPVKVRIEGIDAPEAGQPRCTDSSTALRMLTI